MASSGYVCQVNSQIVPSKETFSFEPLKGKVLPRLDQYS